MDRAPYRVVTIGGGTGLSALLQGLKRQLRVHGNLDITAVVTVTDDGGSSGRLRREFDVLPPGDIRNCMVALSEDEALLSRLFQHRFSSGRGLKGHSFGNLFLTALTQVTGDFTAAIKASSEILNIAGHIYPSTNCNVTLGAELQDGTIVTGETRVTKSVSPIRRVFINPQRCDPLPDTLAAIAEADLICLGPGSLYTSVIPNLLVRGVSAAIERAPALKAYFCNIMSQPGETDGYTASQHIRAIHRHARRPLLDAVIVNDTPIEAPRRRRYAAQQAQPVVIDRDELAALGLRVINAPLLAKAVQVRHDPDATAQVVLDLAVLGRQRRNRAAVAGA